MDLLNLNVKFVRSGAEASTQTGDFTTFCFCLALAAIACLGFGILFVIKSYKI